MYVSMLVGVYKQTNFYDTSYHLHIPDCALGTIYCIETASVDS